MCVCLSVCYIFELRFGLFLVGVCGVLIQAYYVILLYEIIHVLFWCVFVDDDNGFAFVCFCYCYVVLSKDISYLFYVRLISFVWGVLCVLVVMIRLIFLVARYGVCCAVLVPVA